MILYLGLKTIDEFITTEITAAGDTVAFGKVIKSVTKDNKRSTRFVINWFKFNEFYQIKEFTAVFNLTSA
jgi:hypothetical protein